MYYNHNGSPALTTMIGDWSLILTHAFAWVHLTSLCKHTSNTSFLSECTKEVNNNTITWMIYSTLNDGHLKYPLHLDGDLFSYAYHHLFTLFAYESG